MIGLHTGFTHYLAAENPLLRLPAAADNAAMETEPTKAEPSKRKRRWFQFSLRTLLIFTLICAIGSAWVARKMEKKRRQREAVEAMAKVGGSALYGQDWLTKSLGDNLFSEVVGVWFDANATVVDDDLGHLRELTEIETLRLNDTKVGDAGLTNLRGLAQLRKLYLGETNVTDAGLINLEGLNQLQMLYILRTKITDAGLKHFKELKQLQELDLRYNNITGAGLVDLEALPTLQALELGGTGIGDSGLANLKGLTGLTTLDLTYTNVSDAGLAHLKGLKKLQNLYLQKTNVSDDGVKDLEDALPNCKIGH